MKTSMGLKEASQLAVDIFRAIGWWCATAEKDILFIPKDSYHIIKWRKLL